METLKFKTNIKCSGCLASVAPVLNEVIGEGNWSVDTTSQAKILTVKPGESIDDQDVLIAVKEAGYSAERCN